MEEKRDQLLIRELINMEAVAVLAERIYQVFPHFDKKTFVQEVGQELSQLSIGDRSQLIKRKLHLFLPKEYPLAVEILIKSLMPVPNHENPGASHFILWPLTMYVSDYGKEHLELSMQALYEMTKRFTSEFGIRALLDRHPVESWHYLEKWTKDKNAAVRRLVSEGTRPRLPWAGRLKTFGKDRKRMLSLLESLALDENEVVRRSVANHLNDIAKEDPEMVVNTLAQWQKNNPALSIKLIKHALRSLVKEGDPKALALLGISHGVVPDVKSFEIKKSVIRLGEHLEMETELEFGTTEVKDHVVDYIVHYLKSNGSHQPKVFKWKNIQLTDTHSFVLKKKHLLQHFTTRVHYPGKHFVALQINGVELGKLEFELTE